MLDAMLPWQAHEVLDKSKVIGAAKWLIEKQNDDGSYSEVSGMSGAEDEVSNFRNYYYY